MRSVFNDLLFRFVTVLTMLHQDKNLYSTKAWVGCSLTRGPPWLCLLFLGLGSFSPFPCRGAGGSLGDSLFSIIVGITSREGAQPSALPRCAFFFAFHFFCLFSFFFVCVCVFFQLGIPQSLCPVRPGDLCPRGHRKVISVPTRGLRILLDLSSTELDFKW